VNTNGIASKRHSGAEFGAEVDTYGEWLIIGCPGDIYTEEMDGSEPKRNDSFEYEDSYGYRRLVNEGGAGSVYFYRWNGSTYDYVNKVRPPLYQDSFSVVYEYLFPSPSEIVYTTTHIGLLTGNGSSFGRSVCIDKSGYTTLTSTNLATKKFVAIGAPDATSVPSASTGSYKGPYGGVWLAHYDSGSGKWALFSDKMNAHSYGGDIVYNGGQYQNYNQSSDPYGVNHMSSSYDVYSPPSIYFVPSTSSYSKVAERTQFGLRVSLEYYGNYKLAIYAQDYGQVQDSIGTFQRGGNTYFYDLTFNPAHSNFEMVNPYGDRQVYTAMDMVSPSSPSAQYASSILGYSTFADGSVQSDSVSNAANGIPYLYNVERRSAGFCTFPAIAGSSLANSSGTAYVNDSRLFKSGDIGSDHIKQRGRLLFVSAPGMIRSSDIIFPLGGSVYSTAYSVTHNRKASSYEQCGCLIVFDTNDLNNLKNKAWILPAPNTWSLGSSFTWTGGFGNRFDVYQESSTQWLIVVPYIVESSKTYIHSGSNTSDPLYQVNTGRVKTDIYRITYDGTTMSMSLVQSIDGKSVNGNTTGSGYPSFNNDVFLYPNSISGPYGTSVTANAPGIMRRISVSSSFICPSIIKNATQNEYHVAEVWRDDNDTSLPSGRTGSYHLTSVQGYEINGSAFLQFCE